MTYIVGDVQGCYEDLMALLQKIEDKDSEARFIFVGDWLDKDSYSYNHKTWGEKNKRTLLWMAEHITEDGKYQSVRGDQDQDFVNWFYEQDREPKIVERVEIIDGEVVRYPEVVGKHELFEFNDAPHRELQRIFGDESTLEKIVKKIENLPYNKRLSVKNVNGNEVTFRISHAWHSDSKDENVVRKMNLSAKMVTCYISNQDEILVHGHVPTFDKDYMMRDMDGTKPGFIGYHQKDINVNGGCASFGDEEGCLCMLGAVCLETMDEIYAYSYEERWEQLREKLLGEKIHIVPKFQGCKVEDLVEVLIDMYKEKYDEKKDSAYKKSMLKRQGL